MEVLQTDHFDEINHRNLHINTNEIHTYKFI
jgi:hypothetical protein